MTKPKVVEVRKKKLEEREPPSEENYEFLETCEPGQQSRKRGKKDSCGCCSCSNHS